ncbi:MAG: pilus assembly PilX N-terminal domain-containing protein [Candidatus Margulisbacteria bacterium]|nr:pilus assembly PilX N-terminal domain-containing protein [Candidatus Margulisiibacteriota bacterium]
MHCLHKLQTLNKYNEAKTDGGFVLLGTLIAVSIISILVIGHINLISSDVSMGSFFAQAQQASYIAEAGVEDAIKELRQNPAWKAGFKSKSFPVGSGSSYTVNVDHSKAPIIRLHSVAKLSSGVVQKVEVHVNVNQSNQKAPFPIRILSWNIL